MKQYFSRITIDHWCAKNNLHKAAHKLAAEMDRRILSESEVPAFKKEFQEKINALNQEYSRCKPLSFWVEEDSLTQIKLDDISIYCDGVFNMSLFLVKGINHSALVDGSAVMKDVSELRETLEMIEWCLSGKSKNVHLYIDDLHNNTNSILKHFR